MVIRKYIGEYELCLEIWHTDDALLEETTIHEKDVYFKQGVKIKRKDVPTPILKQFDEWAKEQWWNYVDALDI